MASIHVSDIQKILIERGEVDAAVLPESRDGFFLEIRFDDPSAPYGVVDEERRNEVLSVFCPQGLATIVFDINGMLRSIDIS